MNTSWKRNKQSSLLIFFFITNKLNYEVLNQSHYPFFLYKTTTIKVLKPFFVLSLVLEPRFKSYFQFSHSHTNFFFFEQTTNFELQMKNNWDSKIISPRNYWNELLNGAFSNKNVSNKLSTNKNNNTLTNNHHANKKKNIIK